MLSFFLKALVVLVSVYCSPVITILIEYTVYSFGRRIDFSKPGEGVDKNNYMYEFQKYGLVFISHPNVCVCVCVKVLYFSCL